jgi:hypothetical protein
MNPQEWALRADLGYAKHQARTGVPWRCLRRGRSGALDGRWSRRRCSMFEVGVSVEGGVEVAWMHW